MSNYYGKIRFIIDYQTLEMKEVQELPTSSDPVQVYVVVERDNGFFYGYYCHHTPISNPGSGFPLGTISVDEIIPFLKNKQEENRKFREQMEKDEKELKALRPLYKKPLSELIKTIRKELKNYRPYLDINSKKTKYICPICGKPFKISTDHCRRHDEGIFTLSCTPKCKVNLLLEDDFYMKLDFHYNLQRAKSTDTPWM